MGLYRDQQNTNYFQDFTDNFWCISMKWCEIFQSLDFGVRKCRDCDQIVSITQEI